MSDDGQGAVSPGTEPESTTRPTGTGRPGGRGGRLRAATGTLAGAALMITVVTIASRLVGFARWVAQGVFLGTGGVDTPFNAANQLPNVLFEVAAGGALAGAVIPLLTGPISRKLDAEASRIASAFLGWTLAILVPVAALVAIFAHPLALLLDLRDPLLVDVAASFLRVFALQIPLYGLAVVLGGMLQAHKRFFWPAFAPLLSSLVVIVVYAVFGALANGDQKDVAQLTDAALTWLAWGTTAGVAALALPLLWPVRGTGLRLRPTLRFPGAQGRRAAHLAFAGIAALVAQQVSVFLTLRAANGFGGPGTITVYLYTQQVYLLPYAVLAFPLATSTFPRLAEHVAAGRDAAFRVLVSTTTRALLTVVGGGVAALFAASAAIEATFAAFVNGPVDGMGAALAAMAPGLLGYALILHLSRTLYILDRQRAAVIATASGWAVAAVAAVGLPAGFGADEPREALPLLGLATTLGMTVAGVLLLLAVRRHAGADAVHGVPRTLAVLAVGTGLGSVAGWALGARVLPDDASLLAGIGTGLLVAVAAALIVVGASLALDRAALLGLITRGPVPSGGSRDG